MSKKTPENKVKFKKLRRKENFDSKKSIDQPKVMQRQLRKFSQKNLMDEK